MFFVSSVEKFFKPKNNIIIKKINYYVLETRISKAKLLALATVVYKK